ncbi:hypothetical protein BDQ12DRAFT_734393 [Crucibulum laeve]|uniref:Uncharacterized protein n=1 Tax=Crucibulum laeve TaxID=68775 RepID=A0A5C3M6Y9_9AGAR|nr:hypothetical protein BDQ12DRAFT_734393 [Crucibulum laeve]
MATNPNGPVLAERTDIHKSCKSLETLLTLFNDYCEAAAGVVVLQKKLAKALRETAGLKVTGDIASNALNASANVFEALSDIDTKYVKIADKEYDNISGEVKKWFKKLAKEEKLHDERMANANAKIKQAGQVYEKKSKKKTTDVTEEHARYINLISTLGPEVSQEKYNHTLNVTQRHTTTTYSVAACLARIADAEWLRTCEGVRRFAPTIGQLGEWRSLCEGGWTGPLPQDLPDIDGGPQPSQQQPLLHRIVSPSLQPPQQREQLDRSDDDEHPPPPSTHRDPRDSRESTEQARFEGRPPGYSSDVDLTAPQREYLFTSSGNSPTLQRQNQSFASTSSGGQDRPTLSTAPSSFEPPKPASVDPNTGSVRSLSAFPSPPTHFPLPPPRASQLQQQTPSQSANVSFPAMPHVTESPVSANHELAPAPVPMPTPTTDTRAAAPPSPLPNRDRDSPISARGSGPPSPEQQFKERPNMQNDSNSTSETAARPIPVRSQTIAEEPTQLPEEQLYPPSTGTREPHMSSPVSTGLSYPKDDYFDVGREFGVIGQSSKSKTMDPTRSPVMERSDTGVSTGSKVAAIRSRYSNNSGSTSPPPRDLPKLPLSVNDLASRYQPAEDPSSPLPRTRSPPVARQLSLPPPESSPHTRQPLDSYREQDHTPQASASVGGYRPQLSASTTSLTPTPEEETRRRRQRIDELAEFELKEKERELRERERDIELRARELELDRARLMGLREGAAAAGNDERLNSEQSPIGLRPRERRTSLRQKMQRPLSQVDVRSQNQAQARASQEVRPHSQYSYSASNLAPPNPSSPRYNPTSSQPPSPSHYQSQTRDLHTQYEYQDQHQGDPWRHQNPSTSSSSSQYPQQQQPLRKPENALRSPIAATPEKKGGWMRRLSMPGAFNLDSKKNHNNLGGGIAGGKGISSADMKHNSSSTNLRTGGPQEDGRVAAGVGRRSYDAGGISNRSVTNLGRR